eukprot:269296-Chlamydomonas_euryale.AAC.1
MPHAGPHSTPCCFSRRAATCAEEDNEMATDNAVSTLGKILEFHSDAVDAAAVAAAWLGALPLTADHVEAQSQ